LGQQKLKIFFKVAPVWGMQGMCSLKGPEIYTVYFLRWFSGIRKTWSSVCPKWSCAYCSQYVTCVYSWHVCMSCCM